MHRSSCSRSRADSLHPRPPSAPVVEPVFVQPASLITLGMVVPVTGVPVSAPIAVPNAQPLLGVGLFVQAFQLDAPGVCAANARRP